MKTRLSKALALVICLSLALPGAAIGQGEDPGPFDPAATRPVASGALEALDLSAALRTEDGRVRVLVELEDPSLAAYTGGLPGLAATSPQATGAVRLDATSAASVAYLAHLNAQQAQARVDLPQAVPSLSLEEGHQIIFNGFSAVVAEADAQRLLKAKGVKRVYPDVLRHATLDTSLDLINAPEMWAALPAGTQSEAGRGIKVAIIDSGLQSLNPMFTGTGFVMPPGYPRGYCVTNPADPGFQCNNKIIAARYYTPTFAIAAEEVLSPRGTNGHGTHTAGTAVGNPVTVDIGDGIDENLSGVAPGAYLMVYKGLWELPDHSNTSGTDGMLLSALAAAVLDGADVINNSWGGGAGTDPNSTIYPLVLGNIVAAGVLPVFSSGNDGPGANTIGCPGCAEPPLTVGATTTSRIHAHPMDVTGPAPVPAYLQDLVIVPSNGPTITQTIAGGITYAGAVDPDNVLACDPFPANAFAGKIALVSRGTCNFTDKIANAEAAGAIALIIHNNGGGPPNIVGTAENANIPVVTMALSEAQSLIPFLLQHADATVSISPTISRLVRPEWEDILASFSSIGPNGDPDVLKPDIVAPGVNILASYSNDLPGGGEFAFLQGTSMAAPHVTGAAALMRQLHPGWTPNEVKTALTSSADSTVVRKPDGTTPADALDVGAGRLDLARASLAALTFDKPSLAEADCFENCVLTRTVTNMLGDTFTWNAVVDAEAGLGVSVQPTSLNIPAGATRTFTVTVDLSGATVDAWHFGGITWQKAGGGATEARVPLAVFANSGTAAAVLSKTASDDVVKVDQAYSYTINVTNIEPVTATLTVTDTVPAETTYVNGSATGGLAYDAGTATLTGTVDLAPIELGLVIDTVTEPGYLDLSGFGPIDICQENFNSCDDAAFQLDYTGVATFSYLGQEYSTLTASSNGYIILGDDLANGANAFNQDLPDPATPNNVLAGFWTDLDLDGAAVGDDGGGRWLQADLSDGTNTWSIWEWQAAELFADSTSHYTFQIWLQWDSDLIWFVYEDFTGDTSVATIGAENDGGTVGVNYYFDGTGTLPAEGDNLLLLNALDTHAFSFAVTVDAGTQPGTLIKNKATATSSADPGALYEALADVRVAFLEIFLPIIAK